MGICPIQNFNIPADCTCQSVFNINIPAIMDVQGVTASGTLLINDGMGGNGEICPNCDNINSHFVVTFIDADPITGGDQSFTFTPLSINPPQCITFDSTLEQIIDGIGIFSPANGEDRASCFVLDFIETPGVNTPDSVFYQLANFTAGFVSLTTTTPVPDDQLTITPC